MAKRKLSVQQQRRIDNKHRPENPADTLTGDEKSGLVIARFGKRADILDLGTLENATTVRCHIRANLPDIVTGDRVNWLQDDESGVVVSVMPRDTLMSRPDNRGQLRPVAANVTQIAIVLAPEPRAHQNLVDRYLVAVEHFQIRPIVVINKCDIEAIDRGHLASLVALYTTLGYPVYEVSAKLGIGVGALLAALNQQSTVFVGQSGVGKSSLVNLICPAAEATIGDLSQIAKGRHTTTAAILYELETGGYLIDSPGIREFGLWHLEAAQIAEGFCEFRPFLGRCKFRNCQHLNEPGCALLEACTNGEVIPSRLYSYQQIVKDLNQG